MPGSDKNFLARVLLLKGEVQEGVDAGPAVAADALRTLNLAPTFIDATQKTRALDKAFFGADPVTMSGFKRGGTFEMEIAGGGTADGKTIPPWMKVLQYCGFAAPVVGGNSVTISPQTANIGSATMYAYLDDLLIRSLGTRGKVGFTFVDQDFPHFTFDMLGCPPTPLAEQVAPGVPTIAGYIDPALASTLNSTFIYDGYAFPLRSWNMNDNATLDLRTLINPANRVIYSGRTWSGQLVIQVGDLGVKNPFTGIREGTTKAATAVHGTVGGNIVQIDAPRLQVTGNVTLSNEQNKVMATVPVTALPNNGNDEIMFTSK